MKHKFRKRIERLEQIVNPKLYFNSLIIFDPKKPIPPRPPNVPEGQVLIYIPHNGRDKMPKISEADRKELEIIVQQRETEKIEENKMLDYTITITFYRRE